MSSQIALTRRQLRECSAVGSDGMTAGDALSRLKWAGVEGEKASKQPYALVQLSTPEAVGTCRGYIRLGTCKYGAECRYRHCVEPFSQPDLTAHHAAVDAAGNITGEAAGRASVATSIVREMPVSKLTELIQSKDVDSSMVVRVQLGRCDPVDSRDRPAGVGAPASPRVLWSLHAAPEAKLWDPKPQEKPSTPVAADVPSSAPPTPSFLPAPYLDRLPPAVLMIITNFLPDPSLARLACVSKAVAVSLDEPSLWMGRLSGLWSWARARESGRLNLEPRPDALDADATTVQQGSMADGATATGARPSSRPSSAASTSSRSSTASTPGQVQAVSRGPSFARPAIAAHLTGGTGSRGYANDGPWLRKTYFALARPTDWAAKVRFMAEAHALKSMGATVNAEDAGAALAARMGVLWLAQELAPVSASPDPGLGLALPFTSSSPPGRGLVPPTVAAGLARPPSPGAALGNSLAHAARLPSLTASERTAIASLASAVAVAGVSSSPLTGPAVLSRSPGPGSGLKAIDGGSSDEEGPGTRAGSVRKKKGDRDRDARSASSPQDLARLLAGAAGGPDGSLSSPPLAFAMETVQAGSTPSKPSGLRAAVTGPAVASGQATALASPAGRLRSKSAPPPATPSLLALRATLGSMRPLPRHALVGHTDPLAARTAAAVQSTLHRLACESLRALVQPLPHRVEPRAAAEEVSDRLASGGMMEGETLEEMEAAGQGSVAAAVVPVVPGPASPPGRGRARLPEHLDPILPASSSLALTSTACDWSDNSVPSATGQGSAAPPSSAPEPHPFTAVAGAKLMMAAASLTSARDTEARATHEDTGAGAKEHGARAAVGGDAAAGGAASAGAGLGAAAPPLRGLGIGSAVGTVRGGQPATASISGLSQPLAALAIDRGRLAAVDRSGGLRLYASDGSRLAAGRSSALNFGADVCSLAFSDLALVTGHSDGSVIVSSLGGTQAVKTHGAIRFDVEATMVGAAAGSKAHLLGSGSAAGGSSSSSKPASRSAPAAWTSVAIVEDGSSVVVGRRPLVHSSLRGQGPLSQYSLDTRELQRSFVPGRATLPDDALQYQSPTVITGLGPRVDGVSGAAWDGGPGGMGYGSHLLLVGYSRGSMLLWDIRAARTSIAVSAASVTSYGPAMLPILNLPSWEGAIRLLHASGPYVLDSRGAPPSPGDVSGVEGVSFPFVFAWDLRLPRAPFHAMDMGWLGDSTSNSDASDYLVPGVMADNPFSSAAAMDDRGEGVLRVVSGLYHDGDRVLVTHTHAHRGVPRRPTDLRRFGQPMPVAPAMARNFHWNVGERPGRQGVQPGGGPPGAVVRRRAAQRALVLHPRDTLFGRLSSSCPGLSLDLGLVPEYAWPKGHGPREVHAHMARLQQEDKDRQDRRAKKREDRRTAAIAAGASQQELARLDQDQEEHDEDEDLDSSSSASGEEGGGDGGDDSGSEEASHASGSDEESDGDGAADDDEDAQPRVRGRRAGRGGRQPRQEAQADPDAPQFRFHLPAQPGFDPAAPAVLTGLSVWHPHTMSHVGWVPLASATCMAADASMLAVGGEQALTYWHTAGKGQGITATSGRPTLGLDTGEGGPPSRFTRVGKDKEGKGGGQPKERKKGGLHLYSR